MSKSNYSETEIKIMIAGDSAENSVAYASELSQANFYAYARAQNEMTILNSIHADPPNIAVIDISENKLDPYIILRHTELMYSRPKFIFISSTMDASLEYDLLKSGASCILRKPFQTDELIACIQRLLKRRRLRHMDIVIYVTDILHKLGVPVHLQGFAYLRAGIVLVIEKPKLLKKVMKCLYPTIAEMFDSTPIRVERSIRHVIDVTWDRGNLQELDEFFFCNHRHLQCKPTNSEFIAMVSDRLRINLMNEFDYDWDLDE